MVSSRSRGRTALACTLGALVAANPAVHFWGPSFGPLIALVVGAVLLGLLFWAGGTWSDAGLDPAALGRGARWALVLIGSVGAVYLVGALLPVTRGLFADQRYAGLSAGEVAWRVLVAVPVGTVLLEELAFRGVLYGLVRRSHGTVWATAVSSALFGLWHVLPSLGLAAGKPALSSAGSAVPVAGAVAFTAAAGVLFCELRRRSGSLLAPAGLHWAVNGLGYLTVLLLR